MIEANPNLTAFEMKEILKFTAERKGEPTQPDVDPFWNRDFGWGLVDAYEAVKLSIKMRDQGLNGLIDVHTQVHVESSAIDNQSGLYLINGIAWGQMGSVNAIEYRINSGEWMSVAFEETNGSLSALERFSWSLALDLDKMSKGNNSIEIRGLSDDGQSLPVTIIVQGNGNLSDSSESFIMELLPNTIFFVLFIIVGLLLWNSRTENPEKLYLDSNASIAKVLKEDKDLASVVDAELLDG